MADLRAIFEAEHAELVEARAEVERLRGLALELRRDPAHAECRAEVERLRTELSEYTRQSIVADARLAQVVKIRHWYGARHPNSEILPYLDEVLAARPEEPKP